MKSLHGFELITRQSINELKTEAHLYRHIKTGAELLSLVNDDGNKVFGITFKTPPPDSTGVAHILEHSVLCGSKKFPVKEPFVELIKGSLQTFLNAFTYPDKTCYPVASQNLKDFYNLIDVYLDAVFSPLLTPLIFQQEAWHYEMENPGSDIICKGVVFNEMKGAYSSPDSLLAHYSQQSLFPDTTYGLDSGGDPKKIPDLSYKQFKNFHARFYHPSNSKIYFYGNDDPEERCRIVNEYLKNFGSMEPDSKIPLQTFSDQAKEISRPFSSSNTGKSTKKGMVTVNWLLGQTKDPEQNLALSVLEYILLGMPASPLRKALIDSGLGEGIAGVGLENELQQMYFSTGLKGIADKDAKKVGALIMQTFSDLAREGIDTKTVEAAINTMEFRLRENNTGSFPRGLILMLKALSVWLYEGNPLHLLAFEAPLNQLKSRIASNSSFFEELIAESFLKNLHRTTVTLKPDSLLAEKEEKAEREKLASVRSALTPHELQAVVDNTKKLRQFQQTPDTPEALATIPRLRLSDIDRKNLLIPIDCYENKGCKVLYHDIFTNGILYMDVGLNLHLLSQSDLPYVQLFGRSLLETGTQEHDFVSLSQLISRKTGGIRTSTFTSTVMDSTDSTAWLFLRGKATLPRVSDLLDILSDVLLTARLDNRNRFKQILLEEKAVQEQKIIPHGHQLVNTRLCSHFSEADWAEEQMHGISYLFFLRELEKKTDSDWKNIQSRLEKMRQVLLNRSAIIVNITVDEKSMAGIKPRVMKFVENIPAKKTNPVSWVHDQPQENEAMVVPSLVNYVGKGANLYASGYQYNGSVHVITHFLRTTWLWERIRVLGGAYGALCRFDRFSGGFTFVSYRDPNLLGTIDVFDQTAGYISGLDIERAEIEKSIIGAIGDIDTPMLPDTRGYISMQRYLNNNTDKSRQLMREEIIGTSPAEIKAFGSVLHNVRENGIVKVLASEKAVSGANQSNRGFSSVFNVF